MQQKEEEPDPFFHQLPLSRLLTWNRWWLIVRQDSASCAQEEDLGSNRNSPPGQDEETSLTGIVRLRKLWNRESWELKRIKHLSDEELECLSP